MSFIQISIAFLSQLFRPSATKIKMKEAEVIQTEPVSTIFDTASSNKNSR